MKSSPFKNPKLDNNNIEKIYWQKISVKERFEQALSWGKEMEWLHQKIFGKKIKLRKIKEDLKNFNETI